MNNIYFETIKCDNFEIFYLDYHKRRIAQTIGLNLNLEEYIYPPTKEFTKCKVIYNNNGIINITYQPYIKKQINSFLLIFDDHIEYNKKTQNRESIEKLYLQKNLSDEIIIVKNNLITDTSNANIVIFYDNKWITPKTPLLFGTTRSRYLDYGKISEKDITVEMLLNATKIGLLNAMIDFDIIKNHQIDIIRNY